MKKLLFFCFVLTSSLVFSQVELEIVEINSTIYTNDSIILDINSDGADDFIIRVLAPKMFGQSYI